MSRSAWHSYSYFMIDMGTQHIFISFWTNSKAPFAALHMTHVEFSLSDDKGLNKYNMKNIHKVHGNEYFVFFFSKLNVSAIILFSFYILSYLIERRMGRRRERQTIPIWFYLIQTPDAYNFWGWTRTRARSQEHNLDLPHGDRKPTTWAINTTS